LNFNKSPADWSNDIARSVRQYNKWYTTQAPKIYATARAAAHTDVARAFAVTSAFTRFDVVTLKANPDVLRVARQAMAPPLARDRLVTLAEVEKGVVMCMEQRNAMPARAHELDKQVERLLATILPALDPDLLHWTHKGTKPTQREFDMAIAVVSDRLAMAISNPEIRNAQERRQKALMAKFLKVHGFEPTSAATFKMDRGTYVFGRNVPVEGGTVQMPVDCVIRPFKGSHLCVEMKSAGDFTNVNKRRKEEATKHDQLEREYGNRVRMLLQLFGYFNAGYLTYEANSGIDWAWDHRLGDLNPYFGVK
jgi:hypothetical protein